MLLHSVYICMYVEYTCMLAYMKNTPPRPLHTPLMIRSGADRSKSSVVLKFCSFTVQKFTDLQFSCSAVLRFYSYAVPQLCSSVVLQFHTLTRKHEGTPPLTCKPQYAMCSKLYGFIFSSNM